MAQIITLPSNNCKASEKKDKNKFVSFFQSNKWFRTILTILPLLFVPLIIANYFSIADSKHDKLMEYCTILLTAEVLIFLLMFVILGAFSYNICTGTKYTNIVIIGLFSGFMQIVIISPFIIYLIKPYSLIQALVPFVLFLLMPSLFGGINELSEDFKNYTKIFFYPLISLILVLNLFMITHFPLLFYRILFFKEVCY